MYKTAFLHVGYDKTGSTALQATSTALQSQLRDLGIHYPVPTEGNDHSVIASAFLTNPKQATFNHSTGRSSMSDTELRQQDRRLLGNYQRQIEGGRGTLFLSFEGFIWLSESEHLQLRDWIAKFAPSVKVIVYVRDPLGYAISAISQRVRTGRPVKTSIHRHDKNVPTLVKIYGRDNVIVRQFDHQTLQGGDVRHDCYSLIGLETRQIVKLLSQNHDLISLPNQSLSMHAIGVGEALRRQLKGTTFQGPAGAQRQFARLFGRLLDNIPGPGFSLGILQELRLLCRPQVRSSSRYLLDEFGIDFRWQIEPLLNPSRRAQLGHRNQFRALRKRGIYAKLASNLIDQMSSEMEAAEAMRSGLSGKQSGHR